MASQNSSDEVANIRVYLVSEKNLGFGIVVYFVGLKNSDHVNQLCYVISYFLNCI